MGPGRLTLLAVALLLLQQKPTFKSGIELVTVDVHVVDKQGSPIEDIRPDEFEVSISGRQRKVASVELISYKPGQALTEAPRNDPQPLSVTPARPRRLFVIAVDEHSLQAASALAAIEAATRFIDTLQTDDLVGLFAYPTGVAKADLTTDHASVKRALSGIAGLSEEPSSRFNLSVSEAMDIASRDADAMRVVVARECRGGASCSSTQILSEAISMVGALEMKVTQSLGGLRGLMRGLSSVPGRKTLVMVSGGLLTSDRAIGRINPKAEIMQLGRDASFANLAVFALHLDWSFLEAYSARGRLRPSLFRDSNMAASGLEMLAGAAGGAVMRVHGTSPQPAFDRVLRETSMHYLLGVEIDPSDRDGDAHTIRVRVKRRGATVRSRTEVVIPKR